MKNLFNKLAKNIILPLAFAGSLTLSGYGNKQSSLEKYNLENKEVYSDFVGFVKEKGKRFGWAIFYFNEGKTIKAGLFFDEVLRVGNNGSMFLFNDNNFNGMDSLDIYMGKGEIEFVEDLSIEKQLKVAKEYTNLLKDLMHKEKFKGY